MDVALPSMIHAAAPHFLWPFAVQYAAHQLNLQPRVSVPETSPTLRWTGKVGDASAFRFYHPTSRQVLSSQDVTFDESGPAPSGVSQVDAIEPIEVAVDSGAARGAEPVGAGSGGAASGGAEPGGVEPGGAESGGAEPGGAESGGAEPGGAEPGGAESARVASRAGGSPVAPASGATSAGASGGVGAGVGATGASGAAGAGATGGVGAGVGPARGTAGATGGTGAAGPAGAGAGAATGGTGAVPVGSGGPARPRPYFVPLLEQVLGLPPSPGPAPPLECPQPVQSQSPLQPVSPLPAPSPYAGPTRGLAERREPASRPASPVRTSRRALCPRPPAVPGTHLMTLRPSTAPLRVPLPTPPESSLPVLADPESDSLHAASPAVARLLSKVVTNPSFESIAALALVAELIDFAACCRLDYAASLVARSASVCPPSVGGECALSTDVLEDRQEEFQCFAAALPHLMSTLIAREGDPDAPDIPTPRSYVEAIEGPYSSQWQSAMDAEMASWKSTGTYVDEVPPPGANIVSGMWIFRMKRPPGSPPVFKARYVARGFSQRQGVDYFHTFSPTPKMTTLWVLLRVAAQRDYELHSLDFSTAFLQGSLHEEIWLRRPPGFTGPFPLGTQWSLRRPVYGLRQAPREWHDTLRTTLAALGFAPSTADPSLFLRTDTSLPPFYILVYVDDLVFATADIVGLAHLKSELQKRHTCTDLGELRSYLGLQITRDRAQRTITLTQSHMVQQVLQRFDFTYSLPQATPLSTRHSLSALPLDESIEPSDPELVGCLILCGDFVIHPELALLFLTGLVTSCSPPLCLWGFSYFPAPGPLFGPSAPMVSLRVLPFDPEGKPVAFDTWHDDLQLYLLSDSRDSVSLFDHISGAAPAPPATGDVSTRSQWLSREATARLAIRNHLPASECAHFGKHRTAQALYDTVVARYSSPATAAIGRLLLPYLFHELSAFATVADLVTHLRTSDTRYRAAVPADFLPTNPPPMFITLYFIVTRLPDSLRSVRDHFLTLDPTSLTVDLLQQHLLAIAVGAARGTPRSPFFEGTSVLLRLVQSAATARARVAGVVEEAAVVVEVAVGVVVGAAVDEAEAVEVVAAVGPVAGVEALVAAVEAAEGVAAVQAVGPVVVGMDLSVEALRGAGQGSETCPYVIRTGARAGRTCGRFHTECRCFARLDDAWRTEFGDDVEHPRWAELLRSGVAIFDLDFDVIISTMYALSFSAEGDCYWCVPPDPGIAATTLGASASGTPPGTAPAEALHTFTLDSGALRCFFRDSTTLTPLPAPVPVRLADPFGGPVVASSSTVLPCTAVPSGSLSGLHLPSFSTNLVSTAALQDAMVTTTTPGGQRVSICTCTRTGRHLATFTCQPGSSLYTLATEPPQVAASAQVSASGQVAASCSCRLLSHLTLLWHHHLGHPSLPRLRGMHSRLLVSGLPRSLPPLPPLPALPYLPCVEGRQRAAPHSSLFPPTTAALQTFHMDVWGPTLVTGQGCERYFLLVVDDCTRGSARTFLSSDRGGEFSSDLLRDFYRGEGICQSFNLRDSPQQNGIAERRIGLVMEVARTSMIHAAAPHFLWPFAVRYAAHQLNLWPRVSLPETSPTLRWTGEVGDASADKLSPCAIPCDVTFDESVPFYRLFPYCSAPPLPLPLFLAPGPPPVDPLPPQGPAPSGVSQVDPLLGPVPVQVAVGSVSGGAASGGAESEGAETRGAAPGGVETGGSEPGGAEPEGVEPGGAASEGAEPGGAEPQGATSSGGSTGASPRLSPQQLYELSVRRVHLRSGATGAGGAGAAGAGGAGVVAGTSVTGGTAATSPGGARTRGTGAAGTGGVEGAGAGHPTESGAIGAGGFGAGGTGVGRAGVGGTGAGGAGVGGTGVGGPRAGGAGAVDPGGAVRPPPYFVPLLQQPASPLRAPSPYTEQSGGLTERREPTSRLVSLVRNARRVPRSRPPPVPGTHAMTLCPSSVPLRVPLPAPPESSLPEVPDPESDHARAANPTVSRLLASAVTDPSFESVAASALIAELLAFATAHRLDYASALVAESVPASPPFVRGECALGTDVLKDTQEDFECLAAAVPRFVSMQLAPEGDPDARDIPTPS
ncbi:unnamed protein product [Closterium sp. NIES-54]